MKILYVEDDEIMGNLLKLTYNVDWVTSPLVAISKLGMVRYDFVLLDFVVGTFDISGIICYCNKLGIKHAIYTGYSISHVLKRLPHYDSNSIWLKRWGVLCLDELIKDKLHLAHSN